MTKNNEPEKPVEASLEYIEQFEPHERDASEYERFLKNITRSNAARVDREIGYLKDYDMYEVRFAGPQFQAIMDTFTFKFEETAKKCVEYAEGFEQE